ncbi:ribose-phosphate pyrophosphokinase [bacterium BMS3Abin02]|nr:ribose-phosphate pyrophosphokinase [bacterium BMS3Abin02]GBE23106.1 ribose-phosphate pyrophosphokinase [bacterium BMS3Bbin01]
MEIVGRKRLMLFSGSANPALADEIADFMNVDQGGLERSVFANGEIYVRPTESVRGADCFVLQSHSHPVNFHIMEQLLIIDALRRASAKRITAVMPFFGYSRQDKKGLPREPISARLMVDMYFAAGADRLVSIDLHSGQIQGFTSRPFDHLTALPIFIDYLQDRLEGPTTVVSPDAGGVKRAERYARHLNAYVGFVHKRREATERNVSEALAMIGKVRGRHTIIVDDMVDTAGTVTSAARLLMKKGALSVRVVATHGVLSPPALERIEESSIKEVLIANTLPVPEEALGLSKLKVLSVASLFAEALQAIFVDSSVSEIFLGENL